MTHTKIRSRYRQVYSAQQAAVLDTALKMADDKHAVQKRKSGEAYITHPVEVANILMDLGIRYTVVAAAFLHDVLEDTDTTETDIRHIFGDEITDLVVGVTKLGGFQFRSRQEEQAENFRRMYYSMAKNHHVMVLKLADRLHNMRTIKHMRPDRQVAMARETLEIFAPFASRLGLSYFKCELEDLSLKVLEPEQFEELAKQVATKRKKFKVLLSQIQKKLTDVLQEYGISGNVSGRPKHMYSIYRKMTRKDNPRTLEQIFDLTAVRVIVDTIPECYTVLGAVHDAWKPIKDRFKDYIAVPKLNNYRSLHTTVMTEFAVPCEIQIRTFEMHEVAEYGIAAHWMYKEGRTDGKSLEKERAFLQWMPDVEGADATTSEEFYEAMKFDFNQKELFVFTPQGDIVVLPEGATPVDFAYRVHSEVGNRCAGAKINGRIVTLETPLKSGDYVEIITSSSTKGPSRDWLRFVKTTQAISKIKAFFKKLQKGDNIERGRVMLEAEAKKRGFVLSNLLDPKWLNIIMKRYAISNLDDLYAAIGYGGFTVGQIIPKLIDFHKKNIESKKEIQNFTGKSVQTRQSIIVNGHDDLLVRLAQCCTPVPGDDIVGFISRGRGIAVHRTTCTNLKGIEKERLIDTAWANVSEDPFVVQLQVEAQNGGGLLLRLTTLISGMNLFIHSLNARGDKNDRAIVNLGVRVTQIAQIDQLIRKIEGIPEVETVFRT